MSSLSPYEPSHEAEGIILDLDAGVVVSGDDTLPIVGHRGECH